MFRSDKTKVVVRQFNEILNDVICVLPRDILSFQAKTMYVCSWALKFSITVIRNL